MSTTTGTSLLAFLGGVVIAAVAALLFLLPTSKPTSEAMSTPTPERTAAGPAGPLGPVAAQQGFQFELAAPADDPWVRSLIAQVAPEHTVQVKALRSPHARDPTASVPLQPGRKDNGPAATSLLTLAERMHEHDDTRMLTVLYPCRADCKDAQRTWIDFTKLCPVPPHWLPDPGRPFSRFETCVSGSALLVRPDGPAGALAVVHDKALPPIVRELTTLDFSGPTLDRAAIRTALERATQDRGLAANLLTTVTSVKPSAPGQRRPRLQMMTAKDRRGDPFRIGWWLAAPGEICGFRAIAEPGRGMSQQAWTRRFFADATLTLIDARVPKALWKAHTTKDFSFVFEVRTPGCQASARP